MKPTDAKAMVLDLISTDLAALDLAASDVPVVVAPISPDSRDPSKFLLAGRIARPIHYWDGWMVNINLDWFDGSFDEPVIQGGPFYWYVFAIPRRSRYGRDHYMVCDYLQMRDWVLEFSAPQGRDFRDQSRWRADLRVYIDEGVETQGYFRWGDEPVTSEPDPGRVFELDNVATIYDAALIRERVGALAHGGESAAHRRLKLYVASHPLEFGLSDRALAQVEYAFQTGDRVDVMFENHAPDRTVVEVEITGEDNICVGIHQAIKYRSLAEAEAGYALMSSRVRSLVVAYDTAYPKAIDLSERYDVALQPVDRNLVLATAV